MDKGKTTFHTVRKYKFKISQLQELYWEGYIDGERYPVCQFEYFKDSVGVWVNNISTVGNYQRIGLGELMIIEAVKVYGAVYFSSISRLEYNMKQVPVKGDTRYPADIAMPQFAKKLARKGIIDKAWIRSQLD